MPTKKSTKKESTTIDKIDTESDVLRPGRIMKFPEASNEETNALLERIADGLDALQTTNAILGEIPKRLEELEHTIRNASYGTRGR